MTITRLGILLGTLTGAQPVYRLSIQGVAADGNPDGVIKGGGSPASTTLTPAVANTWVWMSLANSYVATRGEFIAIVMDYSSGTIGAGNNTNIQIAFTNSAASGFPYVISNNATVRARAAVHPVVAYSSASKVYGTPMTGTTLNGPVLSSNTTPDESGLRFLFNRKHFQFYQVVGARFSGTNGAVAKSVKMILYDGVTVLQSVTIDTDAMFGASSARGHTYYFADATLATLKAEKEYIIAFQAQDTASGWLTHQYVVTTDLEAYGGGQDWYRVERTDAGAWTPVLTERPVICPIIQTLSTPPPVVLGAV